MASKACDKLLKKSTILPNDIDLLICCTITPDNLCPATACSIQKEMGLKNAVAFDINSACAGFIFGICTAYQYLKTGMYKNAIVVGVDILSRFTNYDDKNSCILFGDGAGAFLLEKSSKNSFIDFIIKSYGEYNDIIKIPSTGTELSNLKPFLTLNGREVFKWAIKSVYEIILEIIEKNNLSLSNIDYFILHQANQRILDGIANKLNQPKEKFLSNIEKYGNTSSASIPILFSEFEEKGFFKEGQTIIMVGFGAGLSIGATIIRI